MSLQFSLRKIAWFFLVTMLISACGGKTNQPMPAPQVIPTQEGNANPSPTLDSGPLIYHPPAIKGYVVFDSVKSQFQVMGLNGGASFTSSAAGLQAPVYGQVQAVNGAVYFLKAQDKQVYRSSASGVEKVNIPNKNLSSFAVSMDEQHLAWSTLEWPEDNPRAGVSTLWIANRDGSGAAQIADATIEQSNAFLLKPLEWTSDGWLLFDRGMTGFGGYIPFAGFNSLYGYHLQSQQFTTIVSADEMHGLCLDTYRLDLGKIVFNCGMNGPETILRDFNSGKESSIPRLKDQPFSGSAHFSNNGAWMAFATARGNPNNESGQIFVLPGDWSSGPVSIYKMQSNGFLRVQGWINADSILFSNTAGPVETIWTVRHDGSDPQQVAQGSFVAWVLSNP